MPILFFQLNQGGLSWVAAAGPAPGGAYAVERGGLTAFLKAAAGCDAVVAWGCRALLAALARRAPRLAAARAVDLGAAGAAEAKAPSGGPRGAAAAAARFFAGPAGAPDPRAGPRRPPAILQGGAAPSAEQWGVIAMVESGASVLVRAVAGAGKSTTLLLCAARAPHLDHLLLTYNKRLQLEVAKRAPPNVTVLTYHASAGRAYGQTIRNDELLRACVRGGPPGSPPRFGRLFLDEGQDMSAEFFALVRHALAANPAARCVKVGDELQAVNEYRGAHPGFLTEAPALYGAHTACRDWAEARLGTSYRLTPATAAFVNVHLYGAPVLVGGNTSAPDRLPTYVAVSNYTKLAAAAGEAVAAACVEFGPEGVFVLAPSVRGLAGRQSPVANLVRHHLAGIPTYVAGGDDEAPDAELIRGKLAVLSFTASKGCERPCVILVGFDESYFQYNCREWGDARRLPNVLTVAATRAKCHLVIVASAGKTLRTVDFGRLRALADVRGDPKPPRPLAAAADKPEVLGVSKLTRHLHPATVRAALDRVAVRPAADATPRRCPPFEGRVRFGASGLTEDLAFVYGLLATALAELKRRGATDFGLGVDSPQIYETKAERDALERADPHGYHISAREHAAYPPSFWEGLSSALAADAPDRSPADWATLAVARHAFVEGRHHVARQVLDYAWIDGAALDALRDIVLALLAGVPGAFEVNLPPAEVGPKTIVGRADFVEEKSGTVWEFKLGELCEEHVLQLACYLALRGGGEGRLVSILNQETRWVEVDAADARPLLALLVERAAPSGQSVFDLVADFDAGVVAAPAGSEDFSAQDELVVRMGAASLDDLY